MNTEVSQENKKLTLPNIAKKTKSCQNIAKYIQHQKTLPPLKVNDSAHLQNGETWTITGKIIKKIVDIP